MTEIFDAAEEKLGALQERARFDPAIVSRVFVFSLVYFFDYIRTLPSKLSRKRWEEKNKILIKILPKKHRTPRPKPTGSSSGTC